MARMFTNPTGSSQAKSVAKAKDRDPVATGQRDAAVNRAHPINATTMAIETRCPNAIGPSAAKTLARRRSWSPSATANSHPMDGSRP